MQFQYCNYLKMIEFPQLPEMHGYKSSWSTQWLQSDLTLTAQRLLNIDIFSGRRAMLIARYRFYANMVCSKSNRSWQRYLSTEMGKCLPILPDIKNFLASTKSSRKNPLPVIFPPLPFFSRTLPTQTGQQEKRAPLVLHPDRGGQTP